MIQALQLELQPLNRGRPTRFTPERIQQVRNLVERGKSQDEIAEIIGVTTESLQVTCSKLGISLRRPTLYTGIGLLSRQRSRNSRSASLDSIRAATRQYEARIHNGASACLKGHSNRKSWSAVAWGLPEVGRPADRCVRHPNGV